MTDVQILPTNTIRNVWGLAKENLCVNIRTLKTKDRLENCLADYQTIRFLHLTQISLPQGYGRFSMSWWEPSPTCVSNDLTGGRGVGEMSGPVGKVVSLQPDCNGCCLQLDEYQEGRKKKKTQMHNERNRTFPIWKGRNHNSKMILEYSLNTFHHKNGTCVVFYGNIQVVYLAHWIIHSAENALLWLIIAIISSLELSDR